MKKIFYTLIILVISILILNKIIYKEISQNEKQKLLSETTRYIHPIKSISMEYSDHSDLKILDSILKDNRILMLGENVHYDGSTLQAKGRLIQYLHENLGYNVVLYEAGQYDCWIMNEEMKNHSFKTSTDSIGGLGLFNFWWDNKETQPLIKYYQKTKGSSSPIELGGFDIQFSGEVLTKKRGKLLKSFLSENNININHFPILKKYIDELQNFIYKGYVSKILNETQQKELLNEISRLEKTIIELKKNPENEIYARYLNDIANNFNKAWKYKSGSLASMHFRDSLMAKNLIRQIDSLYPKEKIIIWCANIHTFSAPYSKNYRPLGSYIKDRYGKSSYMLDFSSYAKLNTSKNLTDQPGKLAVENIFHEMKTPYFIMDLRNVPTSSYLKKEFVSTINQGADQRKIWSHFIDGIFYIDTNTFLTPNQ